MEDGSPMNGGDFLFGVGLKSNKETNDFLRCLWARMAATFGKLAWQYSPLRIGNTIIVGIACIGENTHLNIKLTYKQRVTGGRVPRHANSFTFR